MRRRAESKGLSPTEEWLINLILKLIIEVSFLLLQKSIIGSSNSSSSEDILRKELYITKTHAYSNIKKNTTKNGKFSEKKSDIFHTPAQNIDCGCSLEPPRRGSSNEYPIYMFLAKPYSFTI